MPLTPSESKVLEIGYWDGYIELEKTTRGVLKKKRCDPAIYEKTILKIVNREWESLKPEIIAHTKPPILSLRMTKKHRLLVSTIVKNGIRCLVILEVVLEHNYLSAHFLQDGVWPNFKADNDQELSKKITAEEAEEALQLPKNNGEISYNPKPMKFYNNNFIQLDDTQKSAADDEQLPLIISGIAGTGKSVIALAMLARKRRGNALLMDMKPLIYISKSKELVYEMRRKWQAFDVADDPDLPPVLFMTYKKLIKKLPELKGKTILTDKIPYYNWHKSYLEQIKNQEKPINKVNKQQGKSAESQIDWLLSDSDKLYQEFRLIGGLEKEEYLALGKRQSLFFNEEEKLRRQEREVIWNAYISFKESLPENSVYLDFMPLSLTEKYGLVVVDESPDFSSQELDNLIRNALDKGVFFADTHQDLNDELSKRNLIKTRYRKYGLTPNKLQLIKTYRSPKTHLQLINVLFNMTYRLTGGIADKDEQAYMQAADDLPEGHFIWLDSLSDEFLQKANEQASSVGFAVICSQKHHEEAQSRFPFATILTVEESKGLEFETTVIYRPLDEDIYKEASRKLPNDTDFSVQPNATVNRAPAGFGEAKFAPHFNRLVTAFSRSTNTQIAYQPREKKLAKIIEPMKNSSQKTILEATPIWEKKPTASTPEEWFALAKKFHRKENIAQAKFILSNNLQRSQQDIQTIFTQWANPEEISASLSVRSAIPAVNHENSSTEKPLVATTGESSEKRITTTKQKTKRKRRKTTDKVIPEKTTPNQTPIASSTHVTPITKENVESKKLISSVCEVQKKATPSFNAPKDPIETLCHIYIKLLFSSENTDFIWPRIFNELQYEEILNRKVTVSQQSILDLVVCTNKLADSMENYIRSNEERTRLIPDSFFIENLTAMLEKNRTSLGLIFQSALCFKPSFITKTSGNFPSIFYQMSTTKNGRASLKTLFNTICNPPFNKNPLENWSPAELFRPQINANPDKLMFLNLCEDDNGMIFITNRLIPLPGWKEINYDFKSLLFNSPSALFNHMMLSDEGLRVIFNLMTKRPELKISIEKLREKIPDAHGNTLLHHLAKNKLMGIIFLRHGLKDIAQQLNADDLYTIQNGGSVLNQLASELAMHGVLSQILAARADLIAHITPENLKENLYGTSNKLLLFKLLEIPEIRLLLHILFEDSPSLFDELGLNEFKQTGIAIKDQMLFEKIIYLSDKIADLFINSKNGHLLYDKINPKTKEPYVFKVLRCCPYETFKALLSLKTLRKETISSILELTQWRHDSEKTTPLVKQKLRSFNQSAPSSLGVKDQQKHTFFTPPDKKTGMAEASLSFKQQRKKEAAGSKMN